MRCKEVQKELSAYLDGELSGKRSEAVEEHLRHCDACRQEHEALLRVAEMMRTLPADCQAPAGFTDAVMQRIAAEPAPAAPPRWKRWAAGAVAAVLLVVAAAGIGFEPMKELAQKLDPTGKLPSLQEDRNTVPENEKANKRIAVRSEQGDAAAGEKDKTNPASGQKSGKSPGTAVSPGTGSYTTYPGDPTLLNQKQTVSNTVLKVRVNSSGSAMQQAQSMAHEVGARYEGLGQQVQSGQRYTIAKFTVASDKSDALIQRLQGLGTVISKDSEQKDISSQYSELLSQYQTVCVQRDETADVQRKAQLNQQANSLERQLKNLESQSRFDTIVLWVED